MFNNSIFSKKYIDKLENQEPQDFTVKELKDYIQIRKEKDRQETIERESGQMWNHIYRTAKYGMVEPPYEYEIAAYNEFVIPILIQQLENKGFTAKKMQRIVKTQDNKDKQVYVLIIGW